MLADQETYHALLRSAARRLTGHERRLFIAEVTTTLCGGSPRRSERLFGWGRDTATLGLHETARASVVRTTLPHGDDDGLKTSIRSWLRPFVSSPNRGRKRIRNCNPH